MSNCLKFILAIICVFFTAAIIHGQTLNADTLKKYRVSKILTYTLDSSGQKTLKATRMINEHGLTTGLFTTEKVYFDSIHYSINTDTFKYTYDSKDKITNHSHASQVITYLNAEEKTSYHLWIFKTIHKKPFIVSPFSKELVSYVYYRKNEEIIKRYAEGNLDGYFKYSSKNGYKHSLEKYYKSHKKRHAINKVPQFRLRRYSVFYRKKIVQSTSVLNIHKDVIQKRISQKTYYYRAFAKKPLSYSYVKTYNYTYLGSLISSCKTQQPNFVYTSRPKNTDPKNQYKRHKKYIRYVDEKGVSTEEEFYEYITY
jgi:hypothetical protein